MEIKFSIVIPCFNEESNLPELYENCYEHLIKNGIEVIIVNNGSKDNTRVEILNMENMYNSKLLKSINLEENQGYGGGILEGLKIAHGNYIGWTHADLQTDIKDVLKAFELAENSTFVKGQRVGRSFQENFFSYGMALFETIILRKLMWEINAQPTIFPHNFYTSWKIPPKDFSLDLFAYYKAKQAGLTEKRIKVFFPDRKHGNSSWNKGLLSKFKLIARTLKYSFKLKREI